MLSLSTDVIEVRRATDADTSICDAAAANTMMIRQLIDAGVTALSVNIDAVWDTQHEVNRREQRLLLNTALEDRADVL